MSEYPKYVVMHGSGAKHLLLERCSGEENCYVKVAEFANLFKAREQAALLNKAYSAAQNMAPKRTTRRMVEPSTAPPAEER